MFCICFTAITANVGWMTEDKLRDRGDNHTLANVDLPVTVDIPWQFFVSSEFVTK